MGVDSGGSIPSRGSAATDNGTHIKVKLGSGCLIEATLTGHASERARRAYEDLVALSVIARGDDIACAGGCGRTLGSLEIDGEEVRGIVLEVPLHDPGATPQSQVQ